MNAETVEAASAASAQTTPPMRLQILTTEHASLVGTRSMAWNEAFARTGTFLSALSGSIVALALVGQGSGFGQPFFVFGLMILPVVLFIGITTFVRLGAANFHDAQCVIGMNRLRSAYVEMAPDLERYFVMGTHDDQAAVRRTMGFPPDASPFVHILAATPSVVSVINGVIAGAIGGLVCVEAGLPLLAVIAVGLAIFVIVLAAQVNVGRRTIARYSARHESITPTPPPRDPGAGLSS